ncbi:unnamed protein product [Orchesella dallaii]|uniref:Peptidase M12B domain-containing protein n=1 Tax=Orchesella dallaii TaxID=48710 RepID=A0ABP1PM83_9HEXA
MPTKRKDHFPEKTVELAIFIDQYLYHHWVQLFGSYSAISSFMHRYFNVLMQILNLIYAHPSLAEVPIGFHLAYTQIFWRGDEGNTLPTWDTAPSYLEAFCDFANEENYSGARWDHALLLTGVDLKFPNGTNYAVAGISWDNSMCNKTYSCSVVEGRTFRSVMTAAHEIGHSLGIEHDGLKYNFKCPPRGFIMGQVGGDGVGKIAWSHCSKQNLKSFLTTAPSVLNNQARCLNNKPVVYRRMRGFGGREGYGGGGPRSYDNKFSLEEQCRLGGGREWIPSTRRNYVANICSLLYCTNNVTKITVPFHPALEGTPCGIGKVCKYGECVYLRRGSVRHNYNYYNS